MPDIEPSALIAGFSQIQERINALLVPADPIDPAGDWVQPYTVLAGDGGAAHGHAVLSRRRENDTSVRLALDWRKGAGGPNHWGVTGSVRAGNNAADSLSDWQARAQRYVGYFDAPGNPVADTATDRAGTFSAGRLILRHGSRSISTRIEATDPLLANWQLFDIVQRLPRRPGDVYTFTLIDQFEHVKPGQKLFYRGPVRAAVGSGVRTLHGFNHVGFGTVPWVYWVDDQTNRTLAATSGLEAYVYGLLPRGGGIERAARVKKNKAAAQR